MMRCWRYQPSPPVNRFRGKTAAGKYYGHYRTKGITCVILLLCISVRNLAHAATSSKEQDIFR